METDYKSVIRERILDQDFFLEAIFTGQIKNRNTPYNKLVLRPILIKNKRYIQFEYHDSLKTTHTNLEDVEILEKLNEALEMGFKNIYVKTSNLGIQIQITKKGKALIRNHKVFQRGKVTLSHDREKQRLISSNGNERYLKAIGIMSKDGTVKPSMQSKFRQINEFIKIISQTKELESLSEPIQILDFGCGNAYLTFSTYYYLNYIIGKQASVKGIDINSGYVEKHNEVKEYLAWDKIDFEVSNIIGFKPTIQPQIILSLHACDTATDEALAQAIKWNCPLIFCVPCCHQNLQKQLNKGISSSVFDPVLQHGILKERLGDTLTDTFRSLLLGIMGYKVNVIQFISTEHTNKNIMIRATKNNSIKSHGFVIKYNKLKDFWKVTPYLEKLLQSELQSIL